MGQSSWFGFISLLFLRCALAISSCNLFNKLREANGVGRGRLRRALPLLFLFFFSSSSFSLTGYYIPGTSTCTSLVTACTDGLISGETLTSSYASSGVGVCNVTPGPPYSFTVNSCSVSCPSGDSLSSSGVCSSPSPCSPASGEVVNPNMSTTGSFCDPSTDCTSTGSDWISNGVEYNTFVTNGQSCTPTASNTSAYSGTPCPSGYTPANNCECVNSSGNSYVSATNAASNSSCNGGLSSSTPVAAPNYSPVSSPSDCTSNGQGYIGSGSTYYCVSQYFVPIASNSQYSTAPAVSNSLGQYSCPPGSSSIGSGSSMVCIFGSSPNSSNYSSPTSPLVSNPYASVPGSGSGSSGSGSTSGTSSSASTGSSSTASTQSGSSYPSTMSMPGLPEFSSSSISLDSLPTISETTSETCPSPITFQFQGITFDIPFTYACDLAAQVRPVVIGVFSLVGLLLIVK